MLRFSFLEELYLIKITIKENVLTLIQTNNKQQQKTKVLKPQSPIISKFLALALRSPLNEKASRVLPGVLHWRYQEHMVRKEVSKAREDRERGLEGDWPVPGALHHLHSAPGDPLHESTLFRHRTRSYLG